jgi:hypothetical protein
MERVQNPPSAMRLSLATSELRFVAPNIRFSLQEAENRDDDVDRLAGTRVGRQRTDTTDDACGWGIVRVPRWASRSEAPLPSTTAVVTSVASSPNTTRTASVSK